MSIEKIFIPNVIPENVEGFTVAQRYFEETHKRRYMEHIIGVIIEGIQCNTLGIRDILNSYITKQEKL